MAPIFIVFVSQQFNYKIYCLNLQLQLQNGGPKTGSQQVERPSRVRKPGYPVPPSTSLPWLPPGGECATYYAAGHIGNVRHPETQKLAINFSRALAKPNGKWVKDSHWLLGAIAGGKAAGESAAKPDCSIFV